jgi:signal transduction histidine kinase
VAAQSDGARYGLRNDPAGAERALEVIGETARTAISDLRTIVAQLRDPQLAPSSPSQAQQADVLERMRRSGMDLDFREVGTPDQSALIALTAHRLLGEALTHALKHGDLAAPVQVEQDWTDGYRLTVTNGLRPDDQPSGTADDRVIPESDTGTERSSGHGLVGMSERTTVAGGTFSAGPDDGSWVLRALIPTTVADCDATTHDSNGAGA